MCVRTALSAGYRGDCSNEGRPREPGEGEWRDAGHIPSRRCRPSANTCFISQKFLQMAEDSKSGPSGVRTTGICDTAREATPRSLGPRWRRKQHPAHFWRVNQRSRARGPRNTPRRAARDPRKSAHGVDPRSTAGAPQQAQISTHLANWVHLQEPGRLVGDPHLEGPDVKLHPSCGRRRGAPLAGDRGSRPGPSRHPSARQRVQETPRDASRAGIQRRSGRVSLGLARGTAVANAGARASSSRHRCLAPKSLTCSSHDPA